VTGSYLLFGAITAFIVWRASDGWVRRIFAKPVADTPDTYCERGGVRYQAKSGVYITLSWPFAFLGAGRSEIRIEAFGSSYRLPKEGICRISIFNGMISRGLEIQSVKERPFVFWSCDIGRLSEKLRALGYEVRDHE
jgi:hypothetical protein